MAGVEPLDVVKDIRPGFGPGAIPTPFADRLQLSRSTLVNCGAVHSLGVCEGGTSGGRGAPYGPEVLSTGSFGTVWRRALYDFEIG